VYQIIKYSWATICVKWLGDEKTNISRTISALVFRVLMYLEKQSAPDIGLPEFHAHVGAIANGTRASLYLARTASPDTSVP
jgi:hypothetical protein